MWFSTVEARATSGEWRVRVCRTLIVQGSCSLTILCGARGRRETAGAMGLTVRRHGGSKGLSGSMGNREEGLE